MNVRVERAGSAAFTSTPLELGGRVLVFARLIWATLVTLLVFLFAVSVPLQYRQLSHPPADVRTQLAHAGLSVDVYAVYLTVIGNVFALVCCVVATLIILHRSTDRIGLLGSLYLLLLGLGNAPAMQSVARGYRPLAVPASLANFLLSTFLVAFFFLFPDGRFVPRQTRIPVLAGSVALGGVFLFTGASGVENPPAWMGLTTVIGFASGVAAQIYRYVRISDHLQRQQTKWVVLGVTAAALTTAVFVVAGPIIPSIGGADTGYGLTGVTAVDVASLFIPVTLGFAILRYRLWDIDVVINRTLVYGTLSAGLIGLYLLVVSGLGALVQTAGHLPISLLATALVAVLFAPLRGQLQAAANRLMYGDRDDPYRVLTRVGERASAALAPDAALQVIVETVAHALKSPYAAITLWQAGSTRPAAVHGAFDGTPFRLPLMYQGETAGELLIAPRGRGEAFSQADQRLLTDLAHQIGPAAHAVRLAADLQHSRERLVTAREEERRRLRRDLHDGLGPQLAALTLKIETIRNRFGDDRELNVALIDLTTQTQTALSDIRRLVYGLRPPALDELGLLSALHQAVAQYSDQGNRRIQMTVDFPEALPPLTAAVEVAVYRIMQEALANVVRHSGARSCELSLSFDGERHLLRLKIADDGRGLPATHHAGVGLVSMRERAEELGGYWMISSPPSGGTIVMVELPCPAPEPQTMTTDPGKER
jgi:signal transduction histidine kinase